MNTHQVIQALATSFGAPALALDDNGCASLRVDDTIDLHFETGATHLLHVHCSLGKLPSGNRAAIYERLLTANLFGVETAGATLAIDREFGEIVLCMDIGNHGWTTELIQSRMQRFIDAALAWQERFDELEVVANDASAQANILQPQMLLRA